LSSSTVSNPTANPTATETYTLTATNTASGCTATDAVLVSVDTTLPIANAGTDITKTCTTNPTGATIGVTSVLGTTYAWSPTTGLSSSTVSNPTANPTATETYTLTATNTASGCTATDAVVVTVDTALPTVHTVTGTGSYCSGGSGVAVGLDNSTTGVNYQLQLNGNNSGSVFAGTGASINFGSKTVAGTYTVIGIDAS
jgi:metal-sulfur cluster biosynthetic enzyme